MITVVLNCYKRPEYLEKQIESIQNQTVKPNDIWVWYNKPENEPQYDLSGLGVKVSTNNHNYKFHGRFAFALLAQTEYVAFFDDDTIPGPKWFESCLETMETNPGILGCSGVVVNSDNYQDHYKVGWAHGINNEEPYEVDLVGHAWFLKKEWLKYMWYEEPISWDNGEDMQFSYLCQKYGNIKTIVPPHPINNKEIWGSTVREFGDDNKASFKKTNHTSLRNYIVKEQIKKGWKTVKNG